MTNASQIIGTSIVQAFHELRANKLRTFLSLLGITIGIFCIIAVLTVLDSLKNNIQKASCRRNDKTIFLILNKNAKVSLTPVHSNVYFC